MLYQLIEERNDADKTALRKAPMDVSVVAERIGFKRISIDPCRPCCNNIVFKALARVKWQVYSARVGMVFKQGDVLLLQQPPSFLVRKAGFEFLSELKAKGVLIILLIHDLGTIRESSLSAAGTAELLEMFTLAQSDVVVAHNGRMLEWLTRHGIHREKCLTLDIFDYITPVANACRGLHKGIVVAGNLDLGKSAYLAQLKNISGVKWRLYGPNFNGSEVGAENIEYCGSFLPEELPYKIDGDFGLVWDGNSAETCAGATGRYLKWNNPHKLSLYLVSGMPVIVWRHAAVAEFVKEHGVGIVVESLADVPRAIASVGSDQFERMKANAAKVAALLSRGQYAETALQKAMGYLYANKRRF